jgi:hypothetical protein
VKQLVLPVHGAVSAMTNVHRTPVGSVPYQDVSTPVIDFRQLLDRLGRIENTLDQLLQRNTVKDYYTTGEVASLLGKAEFTVREWCRLNRVYAEKRQTGRGRAKEWMISHQELTRIRNEGLLPN